MKLKFKTDIILVGEGPINETKFKKLKSLPIIALDGGANMLARMGYGFDYLCGDLDSVVAKIVEDTPQDKIIKLEDQNFGDLEKTLKILSAPKIFGFGVLGGRIDHSFEALRLLSKNANAHLEWIGKEDRAFIWKSAKPRILRENQRISFLSFGKTKVLESKGLKYPMDGLVIEPGFFSLSNEASEAEVSIIYENAPLIALLGH